MHIAFDLDDTLIPCEFRFPLEPAPWLARGLALEPLRQGSVALLRQLRAQGHRLWVYTTSLRSPWNIRLTFLAHGILLAGVVNQDRHVRTLRAGRPGPWECSKYPPAFGIDLIVDNSEGVKEEGRRFGFRVLHVHPGDERWFEAVHAVVGTPGPH
jgi:hypothetical protein